MPLHKLCFLPFLDSLLLGVVTSFCFPSTRKGDVHIYRVLLNDRDPTFVDFIIE